MKSSRLINANHANHVIGKLSADRLSALSLTFSTPKHCVTFHSICAGVISKCEHTHTASYVEISSTFYNFRYPHCRTEPCHHAHYNVINLSKSRILKIVVVGLVRLWKIYGLQMCLAYQRAPDSTQSSPSSCRKSLYCVVLRCKGEKVYVTSSREGEHRLQRQLISTRVRSYSYTQKLLSFSTAFPFTECASEREKKSINQTPTLDSEKKTVPHRVNLLCASSNAIAELSRARRRFNCLRRDEILKDISLLQKISDLASQLICSHFFFDVDDQTHSLWRDTNTIFLLDQKVKKRESKLTRKQMTIRHLSSSIIMWVGFIVTVVFVADIPCVCRKKTDAHKIYLLKWKIIYWTTLYVELATYMRLFEQFICTLISSLNVWDKEWRKQKWVAEDKFQMKCVSQDLFDVSHGECVRSSPTFNHSVDICWKSHIYLNQLKFNEISSTRLVRSFRRTNPIVVVELLLKLVAGCHTTKLRSQFNSRW